MKTSPKPFCTMHYKHRSTPLHLKSEHNSTSVTIGWFILNKNLILEKKKNEILLWHKYVPYGKHAPYGPWSYFEVGHARKLLIDWSIPRGLAKTIWEQQFCRCTTKMNHKMLELCYLGLNHLIYGMGHGKRQWVVWGLLIALSGVMCWGSSQWMSGSHPYAPGLVGGRSPTVLSS